MSYLLLEYILYLVEAKDYSEEQLRQRSESNSTMGNNSSVTSLAGVHGPSVGIAVGVSMGVLLCLAAIQYYQNRQLKKRIQQLISVTPDMQMYVRPSAKNPFAYRNLGFYQGHRQPTTKIRSPTIKSP